VWGLGAGPTPPTPNPPIPNPQSPIPNPQDLIKMKLNNKKKLNKINKLNFLYNKYVSFS
jgi:hypothetical protein